MNPKSSIERTLATYGCDDHPLRYVVEPRGSLKIVSKDHVTKPDDLKSILDKYVPAEPKEGKEERAIERTLATYGSGGRRLDRAAKPSGTPKAAGKDPATKQGGTEGRPKAG